MRGRVKTPRRVGKNARKVCGKMQFSRMKCGGASKLRKNVCAISLYIIYMSVCVYACMYK